MKRALAITFIALIAAAVLLGGLAMFSQMRVRTNTFYTDADSIRVPVDQARIRDVLWQPSIDLGEPINSVRDEYEAKIVSDGMTLFLVRGRTDDGADILLSRRTADGWSTPEPFDPVHSAFDDLGAAPTPDGRSVYFYSNRPGGLGGFDLWVTHRTDDGWSEPANLGPEVNSKYNDYAPAPAPNGSALYFSSNRPKGTGLPAVDEDAWSDTLRDELFTNDYDLYVAASTPDGLARAVAVSELNTDANETSPALTPAGDFLYFASDRTGGEGGFDLYRARFVPEQPLAARNLGDSINTPANELDPSLAMAGFVIFFTSDRSAMNTMPGSGEEVASARSDYNLYRAMSREVYRDTDHLAARIDWGELWGVLWPILLWLALALLLFLGLQKLYRRSELNRVSLLAKCLLTSLFVHLLILLLLTAWTVTTGFSDYLREKPGVRVALVAESAADPLASQIFGALTEVEVDVTEETIAEQIDPNPVLEDAEAALAQFEVESHAVRVDEQLVQEDDVREAQPPDADPAPSEDVPEITPAQVNEVAMPEQPPPTARPEPTLLARAADSEPHDRQSAPAIDIPAPPPTDEQVAPREPADRQDETSLAQRRQERDPAPSQNHDRVEPPSPEAPAIALEIDRTLETDTLPDPSPENVSESETLVATREPTGTNAQRVPPDIRGTPSRATETTALHPIDREPETEPRSLAQPAPTLRDADIKAIVLATPPPATIEIESERLEQAALAMPQTKGFETEREVDPGALIVPGQVAAKGPEATDSPMATVEALGDGRFTPTEMLVESGKTSFAPLEAATRDARPAEANPAITHHEPEINTARMHTVAVPDELQPSAHKEAVLRARGAEVEQIDRRIARTSDLPPPPTKDALIAPRESAAQQEENSLARRAFDREMVPSPVADRVELLSDAMPLIALEMKRPAETIALTGPSQETVTESESRISAANVQSAKVQRASRRIIGPFSNETEIAALHPLDQEAERDRESLAQTAAALRDVDIGTIKPTNAPLLTLEAQVEPIAEMTLATPRSEGIATEPEPVADTDVVPAAIADARPAMKPGSLLAAVEVLGDATFVPQKVQSDADESLLAPLVAAPGESRPTPPLAEPLPALDMPALAAASPTAMMDDAATPQRKREDEAHPTLATVALRPSARKSERMLDAVAPTHTEEIVLNPAPVELALVAHEEPEMFADRAEPDLPDPASIEAVLPVVPETTRLVVADLPAVDKVLDEMRLPTQREGRDNPLAQRAPGQRVQLLQAMGGSEETERAVAMALDWLARHQSADGRWDGDAFDAQCRQCGGETALHADIALTGLALLAFLGADHTHDQPGPYRENVRSALEWLLAQQSPDGGFLAPPDEQETMYSHGIATIALCEAYAMTSDITLAGPAINATQFILEAANDEAGGWRYTPGQFGDTSVTGWQVMALASARRAEIDFPASKLDHVRRWIELVRHPTEPGQYGYQPGRQFTDAMTAEGMFIRQLLGISREDPDMRASAGYLLDHLPDWEAAPNTYYWYYASLAMYHYGGEPWEQWNGALKHELVEHQRTSGRPRGSWDPTDQWSREGGRVYQTALCALSLEIYYRYLPMYSGDALIEPVGTIRGHVTDAESDRPLEGATVLLDLPDRPAITARTDAEGAYVLLAPEMSQFFAISASKERYAPQSVAASADELRGKVVERNFALERLRSHIIAVEQNPEVHHLGNDRHEGRINSQFQKKAEGITYTATFEVTPSQLPPNYGLAEIHLLCKGVQAPNIIHINGRRLRTRLNSSPRDGSYGAFVARFNIALLEKGTNTLRITSVDDLGDLDDFEFVNAQIRLLNE